jgi:hypothetical protein
MSQSVLDRPLRLSINPKLINKNEADDASLFAKGWLNMAVTPRELAEYIDAGIAFSCELDGSRKASNFVASDVLAVDVDGTRTIDDALEDPFVQSHATIIYATPSHTAERHRFRLVFALPRTIESARDMKAAYRSLALRLGGDLASTDAARLFYGSQGSNPQLFDKSLSTEVLNELITQGVDSDQYDSDKLGRTTTTSKLPISSDRMIQLQDGEHRRFDEISVGTTVHCPFHRDLNASAFIVESRAGTTGIHCSSCAQTFWPPNGRGDDDFSDFDRRVEEAEQYYKDMQDLGPFMRAFVPAGVQYHEGLARSNIYRYDSEYLKFPSPFPKGIVFIKSPKGTGKTELLKHELQDDEKSTLLIGHRTALIRQSCERLGLECYLDYSGPLMKKRLGVCVDSLHRLKWLDYITPYQTQQRENLFQRIIIDESEQVLSHFLSDTIDATTRHDIFQIFCALLRHAKTVIALDADLGWLTFETLSKLAQPTRASKFKESTLIVNERKSASPIQIFESKDHLIGDLKQSVTDGKRVFVTSNSKKMVSSLHEALKDGGEVKSILVTSDTTAEDDVKSFIGDPANRALSYNAILTSPSLGTGVDITFPDRETKIDVVYGFFEAGITTHFDCDQQIWRVRHPGAVRVWLSPRRFNFDTAPDVVKREIQQKQLYKSVLSTYDDDLRPVYHTNDSLIDMAALARSQQLASKNNLKRNFIAMKRRHGHAIEFVDSDAITSAEGANLKAVGSALAEAAYRQRLLTAPVLDKDAFDEIKQRILDNDEVDVSERLSFARTRIERFYRRPISDELITTDDRERTRERVIRYEQLIFLSRQIAEGHIVQSSKASFTSLRDRFLPDQRRIAMLLHTLLTEAAIFNDGHFQRDQIVTKLTLQTWMKTVVAQKPYIENILGIEVRRDIANGITQLQAVLKLIGLNLDQVGKTKAQSVAGGKTVYLYQLCADAIDRMEGIVARRAQVGGWEFLESRADIKSAGDL